MEETKEKVEFIIKNKPITLKISLAFIIISVAFAVMFTLIILAFRIYERVKLIWLIEIVPALSYVLSFLGVFVYDREEFSLKDGEFRLVKTFKKTKTVKVSTVYSVKLSPYAYGTQIEFVNKKGKVAERFIDDGTMMQDGIFLEALEKLKIPVRRNGYDCKNENN